MTNHVWEFTNQRKLNKSEFIDYFERKIFRTIRKFEMLPKDKIITLKNSNSLNYSVLNLVLKKKFIVKNSKNPNFSTENLSEISEKIFENILNGNFSGPKPKDKISRPLYYLTDEEIEVYAKLMGIKGVKRKVNEKVRSLFEKFKKKNQDLEINIVKALAQVQE